MRASEHTIDNTAAGVIQTHFTDYYSIITSIPFIYNYNYI